MGDGRGWRGCGGDFGSKFDYAGKLLACFAYLMLGQRESGGVMVCSEKGEDWLAPHGGATQLSRVIEALERSGAGGATSLARGRDLVAERVERRGLVIVIAGCFCLRGRVR